MQCATWYEGTAQLLSLTELKSHLFQLYLYWLKPLTIVVVTLSLRVRCMLGVFLLPAFTRQGHEYQDLLSPCDGMHVCTD